MQKHCLGRKRERGRGEEENERDGGARREKVTSSEGTRAGASEWEAAIWQRQALAGLSVGSGGPWRT